MKCMEQFEINGTIWKDTTTYSRSKKERVPSVYTCTLGQHIRMSVLNSHIHYKPDFIMNCHALGITEFVLKGCKTHQEAATRAIKICRIKLMAMIEELPKQTDP